MNCSVRFQGSLSWGGRGVKPSKIVDVEEERLTQATSKRVFRAADASTTPIATLTPLSNNSPTELCLESGGPGNLDNLPM